MAVAILSSLGNLLVVLSLTALIVFAAGVAYWLGCTGRPARRPLPPTVPELLVALTSTPAGREALTRREFLTGEPVRRECPDLVGPTDPTDSARPIPVPRREITEDDARFAYGEYEKACYPPATAMTVVDAMRLALKALIAEWASSEPMWAERRITHDDARRAHEEYVRSFFAPQAQGSRSPVDAMRDALEALVNDWADSEPGTDPTSPNGSGAPERAA